jgi:hypothetical protein
MPFPRVSFSRNAFLLKLLSAGMICFTFGGIPASAQVAPAAPWDSELKLNQIQVIGTHNSYHLAPEPALLQMIGVASERAAQAIDYSHEPLAKQLTELGIRQVELDVYADPAGKLFSKPVGKNLLGPKSSDPRMEFDFDETMSKPGMKILHSPGFDYATTVPSLVSALTQIKAWSESKPNHLPVLVLIELKQDVTGPAGVKPVPFDAELLDAVDSEIRSVIPSSSMLVPDDVRGNHAILRDAVLETGWPRLGQVRGKLLFALDNEGALMEKYLETHPGLKGRVMFASVSENHPAAAWMKINDPVRDFDRIVAMVQKGFLVRTRADSETKQARTNDTAQRDKAFSSGAQFISTDYPVADSRFSDYSVRFADGIVARLNSVSAPGAKPEWKGLDLEAR